MPRLLLLLVAVPSLAFGADPEPRADPPVLPTDPVLEQLIKDSLEARPEVQQAAAEVRAERERVPQSSALPDPTLSVGIQNDGFTSIEIGRMETSYVQLMASQSFPWPGKRGLRSDVAELGAQAADQRVSRLKLQTEADVRRAYLDLLLVRERLALVERLGSLWKQAAQIARVRYEAGEGAQSDLLRAQLQNSRLDQRRWSLQTEERVRLQELNRLRGKPLDEPIPTDVSLRDLPLPALRDENVALGDAYARSPELAAARLTVQQAEKSVALAQKDYLPDLTVSAGVMPRGGDFMPMWQAGVSFTLPVYAGSKQARGVAEANARKDAQQFSQDAVRQVLALRVHERRAQMDTLQKTLELYRGGLLVQSKATAESTLSQYTVGRVTFASVLEAIAGYINDEDAFLQTAAEAQKLLVSEAELSLDPVGASSSGGMSSSVPGAGAVRSGASGSGANAGGGAAEESGGAAMGM